MLQSDIPTHRNRNIKRSRTMSMRSIYSYFRKTHIRNHNIPKFTAYIYRSYKYSIISLISY